VVRPGSWSVCEAGQCKRYPIENISKLESGIFLGKNDKDSWVYPKYFVVMLSL
jgi:hypothetical protein